MEADPPPVIHRYLVGDQTIEGRFALAFDNGQVRPVIGVGEARRVLSPDATVYDTCDPDRPVPVWRDGRPTHFRPFQATHFDFDADAPVSNRIVSAPTYAILDHLFHGPAGADG